MEFPRQEYWSSLPFPSPGDLPDSGIKPHALHFLNWQAYSLLPCHLGSPWLSNKLRSFIQSFLISCCKYLTDNCLVLGTVLVTGKTKVNKTTGSPCGPVVKNLPTNAGDTGSIPGREDFTCFGSTKPVCYNYWAHTLQLPKPGCPRPVLCNKRSQCSEKPMHCNKSRPCSHH